MKGIFVFVALFGGMMLGIQTPINGTLGKRVGGIEGALISFAVGLICLSLVVLFFGKGNLSQVTHIHKVWLIGGALGAIGVTCSILSVQRIGVAGTLTAAVFGQILTGIIIDHFGLLGVAKTPLDLSRALGIVLMVGGLYLVLRHNL
ncbi:MAG TPA: DMT family transporter [Desulfitobacterium dehalogenans]|uniref:DMT family transporter n=1 Tax=Desulfitobacterium dehalogenans TaxID=36854 RepID=A0A7C6Z266_9FIRM|nr:DMT family transporter [Desulfitobacterium dehalogenans]